MLLVLVEEEIKREAAIEKETVETKGKWRMQEEWKGT